MIEVSGMNHFTILSDDLETTRRFYKTVLGFEEGYRPPLNVDGIWFYCGGLPILHVVHRTKMPEPRAGVLDHMAYTSSGIDRTEKRLAELNIPFETIYQRGSDIWQIFFHDPNGAKVELDFPGAERRPA